MAEKNSTHNQSGANGKMLAGIGIAALAAATAGAVFLYGTDTGKKKRKQVKSWGLRMRADVIDKMEKMKEWDETTYRSIVDTVAEKYNKLKGIDPTEVGDLVQDMRKHWKTIKGHVEGKTGSKRKVAARKPKSLPASSDKKAD